MTAKEYVSKMKEISPKMEEIIVFGLAGTIGEGLYESFNIQEKQPFVDYMNEIINLIKNFDVNSIPFKDFSFEDLEEDENTIWIASSYVYKIGIDKSDHLIKSYDMTDDMSFNCQCANTSTDFLDALFLVGEYASRLVKKEVTPDQASDYKQLCTKAAGGNRNFYFYDELFG